MLNGNIKCGFFLTPSHEEMSRNSARYSWVCQDFNNRCVEESPGYIWVGGAEGTSSKCRGPGPLTQISE